MNNKGLKQILFTCRENRFLSQMAEAFARLHGTGKLEAYSAGEDPADLLDETTLSLMQDRGYDLSNQRPKPYIELPDITYDFLITLESGNEELYPQAKLREHWAVPAPGEETTQQLAEIRDEIEMRVVDLITRLD